MEPFIILGVVLSLLLSVDGKLQCPRDRSRIVSKVVHEDLQPFYEDAKAPMPRQCPFNPQRSMYGLHEDHKIEENSNRWGCNYCGKAFFEERYLDQHFERRHSEYTRHGSDTVCLSDFCDIFRCDMEMGLVKAKYWDRLLCQESSLVLLRGQCNSTFSECVPSFLIGEEKELFLEKIQSAVCGFLTCAKYYEPRHELPHPMNLAFYIFSAMFVGVTLVIYYYVTCTHFFTDESILDNWREEEKYPARYHYGDMETRHRKPYNLR